MKTSDKPTPRLDTLHTLLRWEWRLNNARLRELMGISIVRASEWLKEFKDTYPDLVKWDARTRSLSATKRVFSQRNGKAPPTAELNESLAKYLGLVGLSQSPNKIVTSSALWSAFPDLSAPNPAVFSALSEGIRTLRTVVITYRSMGNPAPHRRTLDPHSLVRAGRRWHVRAYSHESQGYRDYALGRIVKVDVLDQKSQFSAEQDEAWNTLVPVKLIAHPHLSPEQQDLIRFEYFNGTSGRIDTCRAALIGYFIHDIRAATDPDKQTPPDYQLAVSNIDEVGPWLFPA